MQARNAKEGSIVQHRDGEYGLVQGLPADGRIYVLVLNTRRLRYWKLRECVAGWRQIKSP